MYHFRNDYSYGAHPTVLRALNEANTAPFIGYGEDEHCKNAADLIRRLCQAPKAAVHFLIGGTSANLTALCAFLRPWESVLAAHTAHINGHEAGAVEATGHKILTVPAGPDGKVTPALLAPVVEECANAHVTKPRLVYLSDATENGTVYTKAELTAVSRFCKAHHLLLFLDGARLGCALASAANDLSLSDIAALCDAFYIGGTKNGALMGEALVICSEALQEDFFRVQKQRGGVLAKGWLLGLQFETLLRDGLYFSLARHANEMAARLQAGIVTLGYPLMVHSPTNQVFMELDDRRMEQLALQCEYEVWCRKDMESCYIRFVTCFATTQAETDGLLEVLKALK